MKKLRTLLASLLIAATFAMPSYGSIVFDGTNDTLTGTFTSSYNSEPLTLACWIKVTVHPVATDTIFTVGNIAGDNNQSQKLRTSATDDTWDATSRTTGDVVASFGTLNIDATWAGYVGTFTSTTARAVFIGAIGNTATNGSARDITDPMGAIRFGERLDAGDDYTGRIAECVTVDAVWTTQEITDYMTATAVPTFTAGPTVGTITSTTIPMTFTSDYTGNVYGTACVNGTAGNATQTQAGQCSGGGAAASSFTEAVVATVGDSHTFTGLSGGTTYDLSFVIKRTNVVPTLNAAQQVGYWPFSTNDLTNSGTDAGGDLTAVNQAAFDSDQPNMTQVSTQASVADQTTSATAPSFTAGPTLGTMTATTAPTTFTTDQDATVYGVACPDGQTAPTVAQVKAGNCTGGVAAVNAWSEATVGTVSDGHTFTGLTHSTIYDLSFAASTAGGDSARSALNDATTICGSTPSITSVDGDDSFDAADTSIVIPGANLCNTHATATVKLRDASTNEKTLTCSVFTNTSWTCSGAGAVGMGVADGLLYGSLTLRFTNDAGNLGTKAVTVTAPSGTIYANLSGGIVTLAFDDDGNPNRGYGYPIDVLPASQLAVGNVVGCSASGITLNPDASWNIPEACTSLDYDFTDDDGVASSHRYIGTAGTVPLAGTPPHFGGVDIDDHTLAVGLAMYGYTLDNYFVPGEGAISARALRRQTSPSDSGTDINGATTAATTLVVDSAVAIGSTYRGYIRCGSSEPTQVKYVNLLTNEIGVRSPTTCADNAQVDKYTDSAGSVSQVNVDSGSGGVSGTPDTDATTTELVYRLTDANGLTADVRIPFQIDVVTVPDVTASNQSAGTATLQALGIDITIAQEFSNSEAAGEILSQQTTSTLWHTAVTLTVSRGQEVAVQFVDGRAVTATRKLVTAVLSPSTAVPRNARFVNGFASSRDRAETYVCTWPSSGLVRYIEGIATRRDGCTLVVTDCTPSRFLHSFGTTSRGELCVTESEPTRIRNGFGITASGQLTVTDAP